MKKLSLILATALLGACSSPQTPHASLDGEVFYLQRIALPPSAVLSVSLQDVSKADVAALQLARQSGPVKGQVPLAFHLEYDAAQVQPGHRYAVSAIIEADGKLLFISTEQHAVKLDGTDPVPLRIRLNPAQQLP
ncbi:YbaY family lipoprotein [Pseudomonas triticifolii]|uniref:YbaY family lipoprotein n=1 Tax=Pseudomonas triticifolii TaxID=2762592 RepID=A0ABR7BBD0_9PSED|nr:YbaY family lipoprotein [Pseudomonas triticifolii]MBC3954476.1 YbaY family lipoprotein [Pseudomonas triticifolii]